MNRNFVRHHCWLVNFSGKPGTWCPIDKAQEMNIKDIKVTYRSEGPNIKWSYLKKLHPAIPIIRNVINFVEEQFGTLARGKKHTVPSREKDIEKLQKSYATAKLHEVQEGRKIWSDKKDQAMDFISDGASKLCTTHLLSRWNDGRAFDRSLAEEWDTDTDTGSEGVADDEGPADKDEGAAESLVERRSENVSLATDENGSSVVSAAEDAMITD